MDLAQKRCKPCEGGVPPLKFELEWVRGRAK